MHELGIAEELIQAVEAALAPTPGMRAIRVRVRYGRMRGVEPATLRFAFETLASEHPRVAGAALDLDEDPIRFRCRACGTSSDLPDYLPVCPACGSTDGEVSGGNEIVLESIEAEGG